MVTQEIKPSKHEFKAETSRLLDIVAKSIYTDAEVFVRELISNASDALEKFRFSAVQGSGDSSVSEDIPLEVTITVDKANRTFAIRDHGIGMTRDQMISHLGTIAKSGTREFSISASGGAPGNLIGQFGVGFYSSFIVAEKVEVISRSFDGSPANRWISEGGDSYTMEEYLGADAPLRGTVVKLYLRENYKQFSEPAVVRTVAEKFSSFINFDVKISEAAESASVEAGKDANTATSSPVSIRKNKVALWCDPSASKEDHIEFYRNLCKIAYGEPRYTVRYETDAPVAIKSLLYVPDDAPNPIFDPTNGEVGVSLYSRKVLVAEKASKIIPSWLYWLRGVVDCEDMPLNISRESMQDSALMKKVSNAVVSKFLRYLLDEWKKNRKGFCEFWNAGFGVYFKHGIVIDARDGKTHHDLLSKLMRFQGIDSPVLKSLEEFAQASKDNGYKNIYYMYAPDRAAASTSPLLKGLSKQAVIFVPEDEVPWDVLGVIGSVDGMKLVSVDSSEETIERAVDSANDSPSAGRVTLTPEEKSKVTEAFRRHVEALQNSTSFEPNQDQSDKKTITFSDMGASGPLAYIRSSLSLQSRKTMMQFMQMSKMRGETFGKGDGSVSDSPNENSHNNTMNILENTGISLELNESHPSIKSFASLVANPTASEAEETTVRTIANSIFVTAKIAAGVTVDARKHTDTYYGLLSRLIDSVSKVSPQTHVEPKAPAAE